VKPVGEPDALIGHVRFQSVPAEILALGPSCAFHRVFGVERRDAGEITLVEEIYPPRIHRLNLGLLGEPPPAGLSKNLLGRMMAWRMQEQAFGGLDRERLTLLEGLARHGSWIDRAPRRCQRGGVMSESLGLTSHKSSCNCTGCGMLRAGVCINCAEKIAALILESGPRELAVEPCSGACREAIELYFSTPPERWRAQRTL